VEGEKEEAIRQWLEAQEIWEWEYRVTQDFKFRSVLKVIIDDASNVQNGSKSGFHIFKNCLSRDAEEVPGDSQSGKSTWLYRLNGTDFSESYIGTMGVDTEIIYLDERKIVIHDIGAIDRYGPSKQAYYEIAEGAMIFYDVI
jgi:hypothetical protein